MEKPALRMLVDGVGPYAELAPPAAAQLLMRAAQLAAEKPFQWQYIDRPADGSVWIVSVQPEKGMPTDGIVWLNQGQRSSVPLNPQVEIEITVDTCGFVPGIGETMASRTRRRYRLARAPYGLIIIHYGRGPAAQVPQHYFSVPGRGQLPPLDTRPFFIAGPRAQQPAAQQGPARAVMDAARRPPQAPPPMQGMQSIERGEPGVAGPADEEAAEDEEVSARTLAGARYCRNHEWMNEVFVYAAFGDKTLPPAPPRLSEMFDKDTLDAQVAALQTEVEALEARRVRPAADGDTYMQSIELTT